MTRNVSSTFVDVSNLVAFSISHFAVDFACAFLLFRMEGLNAIDFRQLAILFVAYNSLAFGLEVFIGSFSTSRNFWRISLLGIGLVAISLVLGEVATRLFGSASLGLADAPAELVRATSSRSLTRSPLLWLTLATVFAGIGNAAFHVGGGVDSLARNVGKYWRSGVFISTGSLGIAYGAIVGGNQDSAWNFSGVFGLLAFCAVLLLTSARVARREEAAPSEERSDSGESFNASPLSLFVVACALYVILTRSAVGFLAPVEFQTRTDLATDALVLATCAFSGKFLGGFLADCIGPRTVGALALLLAIPTLIFSGSFALLGLGVFCLNISTSITLVSTAQGCRGRNGFAFGLTTLALLGGFFLYMFARGAAFEKECDAYIQWGSAFALLVSAFALVLSTRKISSKVD